MLRNATFNRRRFLALGAAALQAGAKARVPVGVLLFAAQKN
jgi:hypothetical protein